MANPAGDAEYPINAVSKLTGVSCHALRIWERRYGFPVPHRSPSGHRRYRVDQVRVLKRIAEMSRAGNPISDLIAGFQSGRLTISPEDEPTASAADADPADFLERMLSGDFPGATALFDRLEHALSTDDLVGRVIAPALTETGERWFRRKCSVYQERCVSVFLRSKLVVLIETARRANVSPTHTIVLGAVQGERHEGGILLANLLLERAGWRVHNLGVDLPVVEFARAVEKIKPDALAVSLVLSRNINKRFLELSTVSGLPVFVGGRGILNHQGLARRFGLRPVAGPAASAVRQILAEFPRGTTRP